MNKQLYNYLNDKLSFQENDRLQYCCNTKVRLKIHIRNLFVRVLVILDMKNIGGMMDLKDLLISIINKVENMLLEFYFLILVKM